MSIEENFDIAFVAAQVLREKQIQQNYRPIIAVHKWFARRPGTLFRALVLSEFGNTSVQDRVALQTILDRYIKDEWSKWTRRFLAFTLSGRPSILELSLLQCQIEGGLRDSAKSPRIAH